MTNATSTEPDSRLVAAVTDLPNDWTFNGFDGVDIMGDTDDLMVRVVTDDVDIIIYRFEGDAVILTGSMTLTGSFATPALVREFVLAALKG